MEGLNNQKDPVAAASEAMDAQEAGAVEEVKAFRVVFPDGTMTLAASREEAAQIQQQWRESR